MRRHIYNQGDFDGACFLYAMANAYAALTGQEPRQSDWDRGVGSLSHPLDFLQGDVGTTLHYEQDPALLGQAVHKMVESMSHPDAPLKAEAMPEATSLEAIANLIDERSVAVLWYRGQTRHVAQEDHWVCAVAASCDPLCVHLACSIRRPDDGRFGDGAYKEVYHAGLDRYSHDSVTEEETVAIMPGSVFRVWLEKRDSSSSA